MLVFFPVLLSVAIFTSNVCYIRFLTPTPSQYIFVTLYFFKTSKNPLKKYFYNFRFFLSIVRWLSEEIGFSHRVAS